MRSEIYGPFEVLERLGVGGMATVHRAIERGIDGFERVVALKRLLPHLAEDEGFVRAFVREAKLASMLQHGNIVQLYELGRVGTSYFISMEYIPGRDLRGVLRQARRVSGPPPVEIALVLLIQLLDALDYAHGQCDVDGKPLGLVHRDISPSNLIVSHAGHLKVIDFGIAKATLGYLMTHTHRIKGKLSYMAPETLAGRQVDGRSDLFSASVIAHELLTATPLFAAKDDFQIIDRLQNMQPPSPSARNPTCPNALDEIVLRGLAKDPTQRWRSAAEMRDALADVATVHQRRLATNRDVCRWMEESFRQPAATTSSRLRLPLSPPPGGPLSDPRRATSPGDPDDEVMDIVWGVTGPRSTLPVVLEDVPDVSGLQQALPMSYEEAAAARAAVHASESSLILSQSPVGRHTPSFTGVGSGTLPPWTSPGMRPATNPNLFALGTAPTTQQQPPGLLEEAVWAARRAEALAMAAMATQRRRSFVPLLVASVAVAAAGGGIAWFLSGGDRDHPKVAVATRAQAGAGAQAIPPAVAPAPRPSPPAAPPPALAVGAGTSAPATAPAGGVAAPALAPPPVAPAKQEAPQPRAIELPGNNRGDSRAAGGGIDDDRNADHNKRRPRGRRDGIAQRERDDRGDGEPAASAAGERDSSQKETAAGEIADSNEDGGRTATKSAGEQEGERGRLQPPPVPVEQPPAGEPTKPRSSPSHAKGPIIVAASRVLRESGSVRPIRFPPEERPPRQITAKLCIDARGVVTSVTVLSDVSPKIRRAVEYTLAQWRYRPVVEGSEKVAACFATAFPVQVE